MSRLAEAEVPLADPGDLLLYGQVQSCLIFMTVGQCWSEVTLTVLAAVAEGDDMLKLPSLSSQYSSTR